MSVMTAEELAHVGPLQREARRRSSAGGAGCAGGSPVLETRRTAPRPPDLDPGLVTEELQRSPRGSCRVTSRSTRPSDVGVHDEAGPGDQVRAPGRRRRSPRSRRRRVSGPLPGFFSVGVRPLHHDPARPGHGPRDTGSRPGRRGPHRGTGSSASGPDHRARAVHLEAVAGALPGHQELGDAEEAALEAALQTPGTVPSPTASPRTVKVSPSEA